MLEKSLNALELVEANLLGVVLNRLPIKGPDAYSYGYYAYDSLDGAGSSQNVPHAVVSAGSGRRNAAVSPHSVELDEEQLAYAVESGRAARQFPSRRINKS